MKRFFTLFVVSVFAMGAMFAQSLDVTSFTWDDTEGNLVAEQGGSADCSIEYSLDADLTVYFVCSSKTNWGAAWSVTEVELLASETTKTVTINFPEDAPIDGDPAGRFRVMISPDGNAVWGERLSDAVLYGDMTEAQAELTVTSFAWEDTEGELDAVQGGSANCIIDYSLSANRTVYFVCSSKTNWGAAWSVTEVELLASETTKTVTINFPEDAPIDGDPAGRFRVIISPSETADWGSRLSDIAIYGAMAENTTVSISNPEAEAFKVYPNPATTEIHVSAQKGDVISLYSINGIMVKEVVASGALETISLSDVPAGIFFIKIDENIRKVVIN